MFDATQLVYLFYLETEFSGVMCLHRCGHVLGKGACLFLRARVEGKGVCHFVGACAASSSQDFRKINLKISKLLKT